MCVVCIQHCHECVWLCSTPPWVCWVMFNTTVGVLGYVQHHRGCVGCMFSTTSVSVLCLFSTLLCVCVVCIFNTAERADLNVMCIYHIAVRYACFVYATVP